MSMIGSPATNAKKRLGDKEDQCQTNSPFIKEKEGRQAVGPRPAHHIRDVGRPYGSEHGEVSRINGNSSPARRVRLSDDA